MSNLQETFEVVIMICEICGNVHLPGECPADIDELFEEENDY